MALGRINYKWGDNVAEVRADASTVLGVSFKWDGRAPATFTRAKLQEIEPLFRDTTRPRLEVDRVTYKREVSEADAGDAWWIADVLSLFNVEARSRGIITRTASPDFSFRTTPPDYSQPELVPPLRAAEL